ncbi:MAG: DUF4390 domain-containing protein [Ramlibacter sp.]
MRFALLILACAVAAVAGPVRAELADVTMLRAERTDEGVVLSATLRFDLPTVIEDALAKGIPMFFVAGAALQRERWYWYDRQVAQTVRHFRLSYQPLTRRWRLQVSAAPIGSSGLSLGQNFDTREEAVAAMQRISNWKIAESTDVDPDSKHLVQFRFRLDVSQLPRPFQIGAVGQSEWQISVARSVRLPTEAAR